MSTATTMSARPDSAPSREPKPHFRDLVAAEWTKIWSLRSSSYCVGLGVLSVILVCVFVVHSDLPYIDVHPKPGYVVPLTGAAPAAPPGAFQPQPYDPLQDGLDRFGADLFMIIAASFGGIAVFSEYASGSVRTTFAAVPDRRSVVLAKAVVVTAIMTVAGFAASLGAFFWTQAILHSHHVGISITDPNAGRAVTAYALIAPVAALVGMALGALIRHGAATAVASVLLLLLLPQFFGGDKYKWLKKIGEMMPEHALTRLKFYPQAHNSLGKYPASITTSWLVFAAWALVSVLIAVVAVKRRDV
jgi:ABC-2 type transport system permease protein